MYGCRSGYGSCSSSSKYIGNFSSRYMGGSSGLEGIASASSVAYSASALSGDHAGTYIQFPRIMPMSPISVKDVSSGPARYALHDAE